MLKTIRYNEAIKLLEERMKLAGQQEQKGFMIVLTLLKEEVKDLKKPKEDALAFLSDFVGADKPDSINFSNKTEIYKYVSDKLGITQEDAARCFSCDYNMSRSIIKSSYKERTSKVLVSVLKLRCDKDKIEAYQKQ
jgi:hypothetical protein